MKPYPSLTRTGKIRRIRQAALLALTQYDLDVAKVHLLGWPTNMLFRVRAQENDGPTCTYVLRACAPGWRTDSDLHSEASWLQAQARDTDIGAPQVIASRRGETLVTVEYDGLAGPARFMLMTWVPGVILGKHLTPENLEKMGRLFAQLHQYSADWTPPPGFTQRRLDSVYAREEADILFGAECQDAFSPTNREVWEQTWAQVQAVYATRYADPNGLRVIHHDLWHDNIKLYRGRLHPLDFEDTAWGYPVQDIAMALQDLMSDVDAQSFEPLQHAFRRGYEALSPWPERFPDEVDIFRAGRMIWVSNWVANFQRAHLQSHLEHFTHLLAHFLETGRLRKSQTPQAGTNL